jgi:hypothetical protein
LRDSLIAASTLSAPELQKKTLSKSVAPQSISATSAWSGISYRFEQWMSFPACSCIAPTSAGWPCPREFVAIPPIKSR